MWDILGYLMSWIVMSASMTVFFASYTLAVRTLVPRLELVCLVANEPMA